MHLSIKTLDSDKHVVFYHQEKENNLPPTENNYFREESSSLVHSLVTDGSCYPTETEMCTHLVRVLLRSC